MKKTILLVVVILITAVPLIYLALIYRSLPLIVATHFSIEGTPNAYSSKKTLAGIIIFLSALTIGLYLLLTNLGKIDPKKSAIGSGNTMQKMALGVAFLISSISGFLIYSAAHTPVSIGRGFLTILGIFFIYIGNLMYSVKPNYFIGIRTPWTLENEDTWRKTHQLASKLWFGGGILIAVVTLLLPIKFAAILMISTTAIITVIPIVYSYRYYQLHIKKA